MNIMKCDKKEYIQNEIDTRGRVERNNEKWSSNEQMYDVNYEQQEETKRKYVKISW